MLLALTNLLPLVLSDQVIQSDSQKAQYPEKLDQVQTPISPSLRLSQMILAKPSIEHNLLKAGLIL